LVKLKRRKVKCEKLTEMDIDRHRGMTKAYRDGYRQTQRDDKRLQRWI
jgi:hypothetical protein